MYSYFTIIVANSVVVFYSPQLLFYLHKLLVTYFGEPKVQEENIWRERGMYQGTGYLWMRHCHSTKPIIIERSHSLSMRMRTILSFWLHRYRNPTLSRSLPGRSSLNLSHSSSLSFSCWRMPFIQLLKIKAVETHACQIYSYRARDRLKQWTLLR